MIPRVAVIQFPGVNCEAETVRALGRAGLGSEVFRWTRSPRELADFDVERRRLNAVREAVRSGLVRACHDISEGGLAVAALEMALGGFSSGGFGLQIPISGLGDTAPEIRLYSEAPGFLMETSSEKLGELLHLFARHGVDATMIGRTIPEPKLRFLDAGTTLIEADLADLRKAYGGALRPYVE